jgi:hypothetical protein
LIFIIEKKKREKKSNTRISFFRTLVLILRAD